jgi:hypothetical protein
MTAIIAEIISRNKPGDITELLLIPPAGVAEVEFSPGKLSVVISPVAVPVLATIQSYAS